MSNLFVSNIPSVGGLPASFSEYVTPEGIAGLASDAGSDVSCPPGFALLHAGQIEVVVNGESRYVAGPAFISFKLYAALSPARGDGGAYVQAWRVRPDYLDSLKYDEPFSICPLNASIEAAKRVQIPVPILHTKSGIFAVSCSETVLGWETVASIERQNAVDDSFLLWRSGRRKVSDDYAEPVDLAIVGAGPAGLSLAAWAHDAGISYRMFGEPLSFWKRHIPPLPLRSPPVATNLSTPRPGHSYLDFAKEHGIADTRQVEMSDFIGYATHFANAHGIRPTHGFISAIRQRENCWCLNYGDETLRAKNVAIAVGLNGAQRNPGLPDMMSHAWNYVAHVHDYGRFRGKRVAVLGGGQSGVEAALLAAGAGAEAHLIIREEALKFRSLHSPGEWLYRNLFRQSKYFMSVLPGPAQDRLLAYLLEGTAEPEMETRLQDAGVIVHASSSIGVDGSRSLSIRCVDKEQVPVDFVIVATGFNYDIRKLRMLGQLQISQRGGLPILNRYAMSSMPGLFFAGISALRRLGPQCQFVFGSSLVSPRIIAGVKARSQK